MGILKKYYVVYCFTILFLCFCATAFAQKAGSRQKGLASWYGTKYHGRKTSSGEIYNKRDLTAAHPSLPFGTKVRVTHIENQQSVVLRINDRGPFKGNRIIDVSEIAAEKIGLIRHGTGQVIVEVLEIGGQESMSELPSPDSNATAAAPKPSMYFTIQAGVFSDPDNAILQTEKLKELDRKLDVTLAEETVGNKKLHRVYAGQFTDRQAAERMRKLLSRKGIQGLVRQVPASKT